METPRYVAKRVGNEYVLVRVDGTEIATRIGTTAAGILLLGWGASHRGIIGAAATIAGAAIAYKGWTGQSPMKLLPKLVGCAAAEEDPKQAPSYPHVGQRSGQLPEDKIDEAAMESFPASDPPASHRTSSHEDLEILKATEAKEAQEALAAAENEGASVQDQPRNVNM